MNEQNSGILDAVIESEQAHALADFSPSQLVADILNQLKERERQILTLRYGLSGDNQQQTLEAIGKQLNLTRERVRQVEKDSIRQLKKDSPAQNLNKTMDIVRRTVSDHG
ncbi:MAG: sigma factor-like helix-turn-helix DNA-binding protein, partial [bacterium]|nr:sigma factor-like helix-turn-helix DNA-binding protein [bacterium]